MAKRTIPVDAKSKNTIGWKCGAACGWADRSGHFEREFGDPCPNCGQPIFDWYDEPKEILVGPDHPAWTALDDDDGWNSGALTQWCQGIKEHLVVLCPSRQHSVDLVIRLHACLVQWSREVRIAWPVGK